MLHGIMVRWLLYGLLCWVPFAQALESIAVAALPPEARVTLRLVEQGGPYPYRRDGIEFHNYEHRLPEHARGYFHEYTVRTPGAHNRGARRIVCSLLLECYYSPDHYRSFLQIETRQ